MLLIEMPEPTPIPNSFLPFIRMHQLSSECHIKNVEAPVSEPQFQAMYSAWKDNQADLLSYPTAHHPELGDSCEHPRSPHTNTHAAPLPTFTPDAPLCPVCTIRTVIYRAEVVKDIFARNGGGTKVARCESWVGKYGQLQQLWHHARRDLANRVIQLGKMAEWEEMCARLSGEDDRASTFSMSAAQAVGEYAVAKHWMFGEPGDLPDEVPKSRPSSPAIDEAAGFQIPLRGRQSDPTVGKSALESSGQPPIGTKSSSASASISPKNGSSVELVLYTGHSTDATGETSISTTKSSLPPSALSRKDRNLRTSNSVTFTLETLTVRYRSWSVFARSDNKYVCGRHACPHPDGWLDASFITNPYYGIQWAKMQDENGEDLWCREAWVKVMGPGASISIYLYNERKSTPEEVEEGRMEPIGNNCPITTIPDTISPDLEFRIICIYTLELLKKDLRTGLKLNQMELEQLALEYSDEEEEEFEEVEIDGGDEDEEEVDEVELDDDDEDEEVDEWELDNDDEDPEQVAFPTQLPQHQDPTKQPGASPPKVHSKAYLRRQARNEKEKAERLARRAEKETKAAAEAKNNAGEENRDNANDAAQNPVFEEPLDFSDSDSDMEVDRPEETARGEKRMRGTFELDENGQPVPMGSRDEAYGRKLVRYET